MKKNLRDILKNVDFELIVGDLNKEISLICNNSQKCVKNSLFVAIKGTKTDGHNFIASAIENGATALVVEESINIISDATIIKVKDTKEALSIISKNFFDNAADKLKIIGITGTNGKTTTATVLYKLFKKLGFKAGLISTIENYIQDKKLPTTHTTPDAIELHHLFYQMVKENIEYVFMEVSSHSLVQKRVHSINFAGAIFTNITHDHLDYHGTFLNYINAKKILFDNLSQDSFALVNADDKHHKYLVQNTKAKVYTYALKNFADFKAKILEKRFDSTYALIDNFEVWVKFVGEFNIYNLLAVYATAVILGLDKLEVLQHLSSINPVKGRFDTVFENGIYGIVDYAHTPDALENILKELNTIKDENQKIITVVGAGGNRDKAKRPKMAAIGQSLSDVLILTSDNPRFENPNAIIDDMVKGLNTEIQNFIIIPNREQAILTAVQLANFNDLILVAGKGHETYQEINGVKNHFDDKEVLTKYLKHKK